MFAEIIQNPAPIFLVLAAVLYILLLRFIDRMEYRLKRKKEGFTDEEILEMLSVMRKTSCYELFGEAAEKWRVPAPRKEDDFKIYLKNGDMPHYVRDFVREHRQEVQKSIKPRFPFNDSLPPSWSA